MSQTRFKRYYDHLMDEKAHLVCQKSFEMNEEVIKAEWDQFHQLGPIEFNKIFNDIDFNLDKRSSFKFERPGTELIKAQKANVS